jgi:prepilin-type processing-associated H-X9-DG protein
MANYCFADGHVTSETILNIVRFKGNLEPWTRDGTNTGSY